MLLQLTQLTSGSQCSMNLALHKSGMTIRRCMIRWACKMSGAIFMHLELWHAPVTNRLTQHSTVTVLAATVLHQGAHC